jgi:hypothetical protein
MHNMIECDECGALVVDDRPYEHLSPLSQVDHEVPTEFGVFIAMHQEIRRRYSSPTGK